MSQPFRDTSNKTPTSMMRDLTLRKNSASAGRKYSSHTSTSNQTSFAKGGAPKSLQNGSTIQNQKGLRRRDVTPSRAFVGGGLCPGLRTGGDRYCCFSAKSGSRLGTPKFIFMTPCVLHGCFIRRAFSRLRVIKKSTRHIPQQPERVLDAPELKDDYYMNIIDWSSCGVVAVALSCTLYLWNADSGEIQVLFELDETNEMNLITSVKWSLDGKFLAVGFKDGSLKLYDPHRVPPPNGKLELRTMKPPRQSRNGVLGWRGAVISAGYQSGQIIHHDVRIPNHITGIWEGHDREVVGLHWSHNQTKLASGSGDNTVRVWEDSHLGSSTSESLFVLDEHVGSVRAVQFCNYKSSLLATGGGMQCKTIKLWNINSGQLLKSIDTGSADLNLCVIGAVAPNSYPFWSLFILMCIAQVNGIVFNSDYKEMMSAHACGKLVIWKHPNYVEIAKLSGHAPERAISIVQSPCGQFVMTAGGDEALRTWHPFKVVFCERNPGRQKYSSVGATQQDVQLIDYSLILCWMYIDINFLKGSVEEELLVSYLPSRSWKTTIVELGSWMAYNGEVSSVFVLTNPISSYKCLSDGPQCFRWGEAYPHFDTLNENLQLYMGYVIRSVLESTCGKRHLMEREQTSFHRPDAADSTVSFATSSAEIREVKLQEKIAFVRAIERRQDVIFGDGVAHSTKAKEKAWKEVAKEMEELGLRSYAVFCNLIKGKRGHACATMIGSMFDVMLCLAAIIITSHQKNWDTWIGSFCLFISNSHSRFFGEDSIEQPLPDTAYDDLDLVNKSPEMKRETECSVETEVMSNCYDASSHSQVARYSSDQTSSNQSGDCYDSNGAYSLCSNLKKEEDGLCLSLPHRDTYSDSSVLSSVERNLGTPAYSSAQTLSDAIDKSDAVHHCSAKRPRRAEANSVCDRDISDDCDFLRRRQQLELRKMELENEKTRKGDSISG
ncbi:WD domain, G-beta repeat protein [Ostertagia ostertagi]